jgi:hypothetical protein
MKSDHSFRLGCGGEFVNRSLGESGADGVTEATGARDPMWERGRRGGRAYFLSSRREAELMQ